MGDAIIGLGLLAVAFVFAIRIGVWRASPRTPVRINGMSVCGGCGAGAYESHDDKCSRR